MKKHNFIDQEKIISVFLLLVFFFSFLGLYFNISPEEIKRGKATGDHTNNSLQNANWDSPLYFNDNGDLGISIYVSGNGLFGDPYIIEDLMINASSSEGIGLFNTDAYLVIRNCTINGFDSGYSGIYLSDCKNVNISNNIIIHNWNGIELGSSSNNTISHNNCSRNSDNGIDLAFSSNNTIWDNLCTYNGENGINTNTENHNNTILDNICSNNVDNGIYVLWGSNNTKILNNTCINNDYGIWLTDSINSTILNNNCSHNARGIHIRDSHKCIISNNTCSYNDETAIDLWRAHNNTISDNNCNYNEGRGIELDDSNDNIISGNALQNSTFDIRNGTNNNVDSTNTINGKSIYYYENENRITISGLNNIGMVLILNCNDSIIKDLNITDSYGGLNLKNSYNNTVVNNVLSRVKSGGISLDNSHNNTIKNNTLSNCVGGIQLESSNNNTISNNTCSEQQGFFFHSSNNSKLMHNELGDGMMIHNSYNNDIDTSNKVKGKSILYFEDKKDISMTEGIFGQIFLINCSYFIMKDLRFTSGMIGAYLERTNNCIISNTTSTNKMVGIQLFFSHNNTLTKNNVSNSDYGFYIFKSKDNTLSSNICSDTSNFGILIYYSTNNTLLNNTCRNNDLYGMMFYSSNNCSVLENQASHNGAGLVVQGKYNFVFNNTCSNNNIGLMLTHSFNGTISKNNCSNNNLYGISLTSSSGNTIWYNLLMNNGKCQANSSNSNFNKWDNGTIGNYWGDYSQRYPDAIDNGQIWDTPYRINGSAEEIDQYPLVYEIYDQISPVWDGNPQDQPLEYGESLSYTVNASDNVQIDCYWLNDTRFHINENGLITNTTTLSLDFYCYLEIKANDTSGNEISAIIEITVRDTILPSWAPTPEDQTSIYGHIFSYDIDASDNVEIDTYWLSDNVHFQIDSVGVITSKNVLLLGNYYLTIYVNDTSGNEISAEIIVTVVEEGDLQDEENDDSGGVEDEDTDSGLSIPSYPILLILNFMLVGAFAILRKYKMKQ